MKVFSIRDPIFKTTPLFVVGCPAEELDRYLRRYRVTAGLPSSVSGSMFTFDRSPWRVVWVEQTPMDVQTLGVLLHEIFHLVTRICQDKGIPIKAQLLEEGTGDETAAYLYDYFARQALLKLGTVTFRRK